MRFQVSRTSMVSEGDSDTKPCSEAELDELGRWFVEFKSLTDLIIFVNLYGNVVIGKWDKVENFIEIYDSYRE